MIFLFLAILGSALIPVLFRAFSDWRVNVFWAIPLNYLICVFVGSIWGSHLLDVASLPRQPWLWLAAIQGVILAVNFFLLAFVMQRKVCKLFIIHFIVVLEEVFLKERYLVFFLYYTSDFFSSIVNKKLTCILVYLIFL